MNMAIYTAIAGCWNGHEGVVRMLLEWNGANPNTRCKSDRKPLSRAAQNGHEGVVRLLLERSDVDPNTTDTLSGHTPLSRATWNGHEGIVRMLLERDGVTPS